MSIHAKSQTALGPLMSPKQCLGIKMVRFESLWIGTTQRDKFEDCSCVLLSMLQIVQINVATIRSKCFI